MKLIIIYYYQILLMSSFNANSIFFFDLQQNCCSKNKRLRKSTIWTKKRNDKNVQKYLIKKIFNNLRNIKILCLFFEAVNLEKIFIFCHFFLISSVHPFSPFCDLHELSNHYILIQTKLHKIIQKTKFPKY